MSEKNKGLPATDPTAAAAQTIVTSEPDAGEPTIEDKPAKYRVRSPRGLNLRSGPGRDNAVLRVLPWGTVLEATGPVEDAGGSQWLPVAGGYVDSAYLVLSGSED